MPHGPGGPKRRPLHCDAVGRLRQSAPAPGRTRASRLTTPHAPAPSVRSVASARDGGGRGGSGVAHAPRHRLRTRGGPADVTRARVGRTLRRPPRASPHLAAPPSEAPAGALCRGRPRAESRKGGAGAQGSAGEALLGLLRPPGPRAPRGGPAPDRPPPQPRPHPPGPPGAPPVTGALPARLRDPRHLRGAGGGHPWPQRPAPLRKSPASPGGPPLPLRSTAGDCLPG